MNTKHKIWQSIISFLLANLLLLSLVSCGSRGKDESSQSKASSGSEEQPSYSEIKWPKSDIAALISEPKSNIGRIEWEKSTGFVIYVSETSKEDYDAYVDDCWDRGFKNDYSRGDDYFWASNSDGYEVTVRFEPDDEDNNVMFIRMDDPPDDFEPSNAIVKTRTESGFDPKTNQTIDFWGLEFSFPAYFDVHAENSTETLEHFYPEEESYYATLSFKVEDLAGMSQEEFDEGKSGLNDTVLKGELSNITELKTESTTVANLSAWHISYINIERAEDPSTINYTFVFNPNNEKLILIYLSYDEKDTSTYDYVGDYQKILASAKLTNTENSSSSNPTTVDGIRPEFKEAMDSYEAFYDEYCALMEQYRENPTDLTLLGKYADMLSKQADMNKKFEAWESEDMNDEELKYYLEVNDRITTKLLDVAG